MVNCKKEFGEILNFVYQNYDWNDILPALLNVYWYLKDIETRRTAHVFTTAKKGWKVCSRGGEKKPANYDNFGYNPNTRDKFTSSCLEHKRIYDRSRHLENDYNLPPEVVLKRLCEQNDKCKSCGAPINIKTLEPHHDQGIVYDFLCHNCNSIVAFAHHDYKFLLKCTIYQAKNEGKSKEDIIDLLKGSFD